MDGGGCESVKEGPLWRGVGESEGEFIVERGGE